MKLYEIPHGSSFRLLAGGAIPPDAPEVEEGAVYRLRAIDGMYGNCKDASGQAVYIVAWADVEPV